MNLYHKAIDIIRRWWDSENMSRYTTPTTSSRQRVAAAMQFAKWRDEGHGMQITEDTAFNLTDGVCGKAGSETLVNLSSTAVRYLNRKDK